MRIEAAASKDRRTRILDGALAAFLRFGFERSSMADIAKGAGVTRTALYHYFPGKDDVLRALIDALHARTHEIAVDALERSPDLKTALRDLLAAKFGRALSLMNESPNGVELADATHRLTERATLAADLAFQELVVAALVRHGRPEDAEAVADTLIASAKGLMRAGNAHATKQHFDDRLDRLVAWATSWSIEVPVLSSFSD